MKKTVLITGGAKGLGRAIAKKFAKNDYDIIVTYNKSQKEAELLKDELIKNYNVDVQIFKLDLESDEEIENLFKNIDILDVLINNAAYNDDQSWTEKTRDSFLQILNINTVAPFLMAKKSYPLLKEKEGSIINISSTNGIDSMYTDSLDYDASKAALNNLTKNLSIAFAPKIRVNAIAAGWIETHNTEDIEEKFKEKETKKILEKRFADPSEIANLAYFLASDEASYINGSIIRIDGGRNYEN